MLVHLATVVMAIVVLVGAVRLLRHWFDVGRGLGLGLFTPYREAPWPRGVQEEDEVRFDLGTGIGTHARPEPAGPVDFGDAPPRRRDDVVVVVEELARPAITPQRVRTRHRLVIAHPRTR